MMSACRAAWASPLAIDGHQNGHPLLPGAQGAHPIELVVRTAKGHLLAIEQLAHDLDGLGKTRLAHGGWIERLADGGVLGEGVAGADADLEPPASELVNAGQLARQMHRVVEVVVQHQRADPEPGRAIGGGQQGCEWGPAVHNVVPGVEDIEASGLGAPRQIAQLIGRDLSDLETESKRTHRLTVARRVRSPQNGQASGGHGQRRMEGRSVGQPAKLRQFAQGLPGLISRALEPRSGPSEEGEQLVADTATRLLSVRLRYERGPGAQPGAGVPPNFAAAGTGAHRHAPLLHGQGRPSAVS